MTDAEAIPKLEAFRDFCRLSARLGFQVRLTGQSVELRALLGELCAQPPRLTLEAEVLHGALVVELGARAARALRRARRRVRRAAAA